VIEMTEKKSITLTLEEAQQLRNIVQEKMKVANVRMELEREYETKKQDLILRWTQLDAQEQKLRAQICFKYGIPESTPFIVSEKGQLQILKET